MSNAFDAMQAVVARLRRDVEESKVGLRLGTLAPGGVILDGETAITPAVGATGQPGARVVTAHQGRRTYALGTLRHFDPVEGIYGHSEGVSQWRTRLAGTRRQDAYRWGGLKTCNVSVMGTSSVGGMGSPGLDAWAYQLRALLAADGMTVGGTGVVFAGAGILNEDPRWTRSGAGLYTEHRLYATIPNGSWVQFASESPGSTVKIHYLSTGGAFTYSIDGGSAVTVTPTGSARATVTVSGLASSTHTVRVTATTGTPALLLGVEVLASETGLHFTVAGVSGSTTAHWSGISTDAGDNLPTARIRQPHLTILAMGGNDANTGVPTGTVKANLRAIINWGQAWGSGHMLVVMPHANSITLDAWRLYVRALYEVADEYGIPLVDMTYRWGSLDAAAAAGLMNDYIHPNAAGHADYARAVARALGVR